MAKEVPACKVHHLPTFFQVLLWLGLRTNQVPCCMSVDTLVMLHFISFESVCWITSDNDVYCQTCLT